MPVITKRKVNYWRRRLTRREIDYAGFTILELMVASTVFAVIMLVVAFGVISFTNSYSNGIISSVVQSSARSIMAQISDTIEFSEGSPIIISAGSDSNNQNELCVDGSTMYIWVLGQEVTDNSTNISQHQAYQALLDSNYPCDSILTSNFSTWINAQNPNNGNAFVRELLGQHMRLNTLSLTTSGDNLYTIHIRVIYGDDDLLTPSVSNNTNWETTTESCAPGAGSQFCAVSDLTTTVEQRL